MRLRHVHVRRCPPLDDVAVSFGEEALLDQACAIHFVVGVNGSGKTRFLRALAEALLCLERQLPPPFPCTLVFDLGAGPAARTIVYDNSGHHPGGSFLAEFPRLASAEAIQDLLAGLAAVNQTGDRGALGVYTNGDWPGSGAMARFLPRDLLVHTSGAAAPWRTTFAAASSSEAVQAVDLDALTPEDERPRAWDDRREADRIRAETGHEPTSGPASRPDPGPGPAALAAPAGEVEPATPSVGLFVAPDELETAACVVTVAQAFADFAQYPTAAERRAFVDTLRTQRGDSPRLPGLRGLLNVVDWVWPVGLALHLRREPDPDDPEQAETLAQLAPLATTTHRDPGDGPEVHLYLDLTRRPNLDEKQRSRADARPMLVAQFLRREPCAPIDVFRKLCAWRRSGLITGMQWIVRKLDTDDLLLYDQLSDGEREFLGRLALLHLLESRPDDADAGEAQDALVLLDEPETHYNDVWKRELVAIIGDVLHQHASQVLISTHSSIALTDVFDEEITLLEKREDGIRVVPVRISTFGADPSEIMVRVFGAPESIGCRSLQWLDEKLDEARTWGPERAHEPRHLVRQVGPGFHRSEFRGILKRLSGDAP